jgi:hypothetical protein
VNRRGRCLYFDTGTGVLQLIEKVMSAMHPEGLVLPRLPFYHALPGEEAVRGDVLDFLEIGMDGKS